MLVPALGSRVASAVNAVRGPATPRTTVALPPTANLWALWPYDDASVSANVVTDYSGRGNALPMPNGATSVAGSIGTQARSFASASSQHTNYPLDGVTPQPWTIAKLISKTNANPFTTTFHMKGPFTGGFTTNVYALLSGKNSFDNCDFRLYYNRGGTIVVEYYNGQNNIDVYLGWNLPAGWDETVWHDIVWTGNGRYGQTNQQLYIDGVAMSIAFDTQGGWLPTGDFGVGLAVKGANDVITNGYTGMVKAEETWWNVQYTAAQAGQINTLRRASVSLRSFLGL